jgi:hypothetical protein
MSSYLEVKEFVSRSVSSSVADPDPFDTDMDPAFQFYMNPDPYRFKEVMYLKQYFLYIFT